MIRIVLAILLFLFLTVVQSTILPQLKSAEYVLLPLVVLLFAVDSWPKPVTYTAAITAAVSVSLFSTAPLNAYLIAFVITIVTAEILHERFFTNKSFYGMLFLTIIATVVFESILFIAMIFTSDAESLSLSHQGIHVWHRTVGNTVAMVGIIYIAHGIARIFHSWFFIRKSNRP